MKPLYASSIVLLLAVAFFFSGCNIASDSPVGYQPNTSIPEEFIARNITQTSVELVWRTPKNTQEIVCYQLLMAGSVLATIDKAATSHTIANLRPNTSYTFLLQSVDDNGTPSEAAVVEVRTAPPGPPATPHLFTAKNIRSTEVDLAWEASVNAGDSDFSHYLLTYDRKSAIIDKAATSYTVGNLHPGTEYTFLLASHTTDGRESITAAFTITTKP